MKKNIVLIVFLGFLMVMNGVLLFLVVKKPNQRHGPPREFISNQLDFNEVQTERFMELDREHHRKMRGFDNELRDRKEVLFSHLGDTDFSDKELDSLTKRISELSKAREMEVFRYFRQIEEICDTKQKQKLQRIVSGALRPGPPGDRPPPGGPPPR
ncbi:MAG: hypothetical protein AAGC43_08095 [Bacteroidota bacterium]